MEEPEATNRLLACQRSQLSPRPAARRRSEVEDLRSAELAERAWRERPSASRGFGREPRGVDSRGSKRGAAALFLLWKGFPFQAQPTPKNGMPLYLTLFLFVWVFGSLSKSTNPQKWDAPISHLFLFCFFLFPFQSQPTQQMDADSFSRGHWAAEAWPKSQAGFF